MANKFDDMKNKLGKDWASLRADESQSQEQQQDEEPLLKHESFQEMDDKLTEEEQKSEKYRQDLVRAQAEIQNIKRRAELDVVEAHKYANKKLLNELLPVLDSLGHSLEGDVDEAQSHLREGVELTLKMLLTTLEKFGVKQIDPQPGQPFDPALHEAMSAQQAANMPANSVIMVLQKGYQLHDRLVRPARVIVAKE